MKKKSKIYIITIIMYFFIFFIYMNKFYSNASLFSDINSQASGFLSKGSSEAGDLSGVTSTVTSNFSELGQILTYIGAGIMVAVVSYMGIKYLIAPPDKQAALKQQLIGVLVSGIVIFGAYGIWSALLEIGSKLD